MNSNQKAIQALENNDYEDALLYFQKALVESRDVQSLTNQAWFYIHEEMEYEKALALVEEAIQLNPTSYFPYCLLGEIYLLLKKWQDAKEILAQAPTLPSSKATYNNLAIANYQLGNLKEASANFLLAADKSDWDMFGHVKCLIDLGEASEAKGKLGQFSENDDEFVGSIDVADLYVELGLYKEAVEWFEKGWVEYLKQSEWISRYVYALFKLGNSTRTEQILEESIAHQTIEIKKASAEECDEDWTQSDKQNHIKQLWEEKEEYEQLIERISSGHIPALKFEPVIQSDCYLFGCTRHNHAEY
ncbi:tetratricopeptide repeat protein [Paenisporosarcina indica]|uniref:tetratricopeptide repeat protein n=1 Tax=Paenisporosarcina indica TaxID=650093 RepID=UPI00094F5764|nr:tetratricopeptide repeat protein [Paenisporosarcina indica]